MLILVPSFSLKAAIPDFYTFTIINTYFPYLKSRKFNTSGVFCYKNIYVMLLLCYNVLYYIFHDLMEDGRYDQKR